MSASNYWLERSYLSSARLNLQHYILSHGVGYLLHPTIRAHLAEGSTIADIGTGTGVWLLDLSSSLPSTTQLHGFDISLSQVCAQQWLPANVRMHQWDMFQDVPEEHLGKYDVVHIRFVIPVVRHDAAPVLRRLMGMLKPGGWLQWMEQDPYTFEPRVAVVGSPVPATEKAFNVLSSHLHQLVGPSPGWVASLPDTFQAEGLVDVASQAHKKPKWAMAHFHDTVLMAVDEMAPHFEGKDLKRLSADAAREMEQLSRGIGAAGDIVVAIGRKPTVE